MRFLSRRSVRILFILFFLALRFFILFTYFALNLVLVTPPSRHAQFDFLGVPVFLFIAISLYSHYADVKGCQDSEGFEVHLIYSLSVDFTYFFNEFNSSIKLI